MCAQSPWADLTLSSDLEARLFDGLLGSAGFVTPAISEGAAKGKYLRRAALGEIPNMENAHLTAPDAVAIRHDGAFAEFRDGLHGALDRLEGDMTPGAASAKAVLDFEREKRGLSRRLNDRVSRTTLREQLKSAAVPASLGVVASAPTATMDDLSAATMAGAGAAGGVIWNWLSARRTKPGLAVAVRYAADLSGERRKLGGRTSSAAR